MSFRAGGPELRLLEGSGPEAGSDLANLRRCFGRIYERGADVWSAEPAMRVAPEVLLSELSRPSRVLDVGTGRGIDAEAMAAHGHTVVGIDLVAVDGWPALLRRTPRLSLVQGTPGCVARSGAFDAVLDNGCLHHQHPDRLPGHLRDIARALRPGGVLVAGVFQPQDGPRTFVTEQGRLNREIDAGELERLLEVAGTPVVERELLVARADGRAYRVVVAQRSG